MSFEKFNLAAENEGEPSKIRFYYPTDKIFNSVSLRTTYRANMVKSNDGESQLDDIAISQDERDIMEEFLADAIYEIAAEIFKITEGIDQSVFVNKNIIISDGSGKSASDIVATSSAILPTTPDETKIYEVITTSWGGFSIGEKVRYINGSFININQIASGCEIRDNSAFNINILPSIDKKMEACIRYYIMREWYGSTGLVNDMNLNQAMYKANIIKLKNLTFQLRKPLMS